MSNGEFPQNFKVRSIRLENFRVYKSKKIEIDADIVFFIGKNGIGKTSILEAIALLGNLKSFRGVADKDLIRFKENQYFLEMEYTNSIGNHKVSVGYGKNASSDSKYQRRMQYDGKSLDRISDFIGKIQTVVFAPNDIDIIESGPSERRRFVDIVLSSIYSEYLINLQNFKRLLKHRSSLFQKFGNRIDPRFLASIDTEIIKAGSIIQSYRQKFINEFQGMFEKFVHEISSEADNWSIEYQPSIPGGEDSEVYRKKFALSLPDDIRLRQTLTGIHRDKIIIPKDRSNPMDILKIGSQGQKRTVVLALKMAQYNFTKSITSEKPVLLIDDVLNELDITRRKKFIEFLREVGQSFITATDIVALDDIIERKSESVKIQIFEMEDSILTDLK